MTQARQDGISLKQWLPLIGLACCAFVFNTSEFMPIGLLTDIAASFSLTEAQAGIMISVYAWGVMLLSLPLMVFASRFEFKRMLLGVLAVFSLGQFLSAVAPTYPILVCARLVVACAHAVFWSVASIMGLAPGRQSPRSARHQHDRHGLVHRADLWPADRPRHRAGRGLAHDVCRGRGPLSHRGRLPGRGVPGHARRASALPSNSCPSCSRIRSWSRSTRSRFLWRPAITQATATLSLSWRRSHTSTRAPSP